MQSGWNTWNDHNVLQHVLLPQGFVISIGLKQAINSDNYTLDEDYIDGSCLNQKKINPGLHSFDGSYTELDLELKNVTISLKSAQIGNDLVILIDRIKGSEKKIKVVIETGLLWNSKGSITQSKSMIKAILPGKIIKVFSTENQIVDDPYLPIKTPYLCFLVGKKIGISTGRERSISEIESVINLEKNRMLDRAKIYGNLSNAYSAIESLIGWSLIYEPKFDRVISTERRFKKKRNDGYYCFNWDGFLIPYLSCLINQDIAYVNVIERFNNRGTNVLIRKNNIEDDIKYFEDHNIPVSSIIVKEVYKRYPNIWFLEACFEDLITWNRWWPKFRMDNGVLGFEYSKIRSDFINSVYNDNFYMDISIDPTDSLAIGDIGINKTSELFPLNKVGLNSLYIADCIALLEIASILERKEVIKELKSRIKYFKREMERFWDQNYGVYHNHDFNSDPLVKHFSPAIFFPLLANVGDQEQRQKIHDHFYKKNNFFGELIFSSNTKNNILSKENKVYVAGISPTINFLTYLGFRKAGFLKAAEEILIISQGLLDINTNLEINYKNEISTKNLLSNWDIMLGMMKFIENEVLPKPEISIQ